MLVFKDVHRKTRVPVINTSYSYSVDDIRHTLNGFYAFFLLREALAESTDNERLKIKISPLRFTNK